VRLTNFSMNHIVSLTDG